MRIVSLRAPAPAAMAIYLHPRLTLLAGTTTSDRLALQSVFRALVGADASRLEVVLAGMTGARVARRTELPLARVRNVQRRGGRIA